MSINRSSSKLPNEGGLAKKSALDASDTSNISIDNKLLDKKSLDKNIDHFFKKSATDSFIKNNNLNPNNSLTHSGVANKQEKVPVKLLNADKSKKSYFADESKKSESRPKSKAKKVEYIGRDDKVGADVFYKIKDENDILKKQQITLNDDIKRLNAALEKVKYDVLVERRLSDRKVIKVDNEFNIEAETIKGENEKLKDKLRKMNTIIQGLQSEKKVKSFGPKKGLASAEKQFISQNEKNDFFKCINLLREQLKSSESEVKRLHAELYGPNSKVRNIGDYAKELKEKNNLLAELQTNYEKLCLQFDTNVKIMEHTKVSLEDYIAKYNDERRKNMDAENRIQLMEANLAKMPEYTRMIDDYKFKERELENRIRDLCENPFIKQAEERGNVFRKVKELEEALSISTNKLRSLEESHKFLEKEAKTLRDELNIASIERDKYKEENLRYKISIEEREKHAKNFEEQLRLLGQYGEVDSNFVKIMNIMKIKEDDNSWMKINFLEKINESDSRDPDKLLKEIERVKIEKGLLGNELEKTRSLLQIQQQINEDQQSMFNEEKKIFKHQIDKLSKKCDELSKLVDIERLPKNFLNLHSPKSSAFAGKDPNLLINELIPSDKLVNLMSDAITEFSKDETDTDMGLNENCLDLYVGEAIFEPGVEKDLKLSLNNIMSFIAVDFYLHETQTSNLNSGLKPMYNLQLSFRVTVDENFIHYLESESISVDVYYIKDNVQAILGKAKISLLDILESENPSSNKFVGASLHNGTLTNLTRVINSVCTIYYGKDQTMKIGSLHYKMRMRNPILEVIKWYREKNQMLREISPIHDVTLKRVEKEIANLNTNIFTKGKVMSVTILITKCSNLKISGPPRKIMPYVYYQFYKFDDHYSKTVNGTDPLFQDVEKFDVVYDKTFHDYVEREALEIMLLDDSRALEVEMRQDENKNNLVSLVDQGEFDDLIGTAKIPLQQLLVNDLIQNSFPLLNKRGQNAGEIVLNIFWEKVEMNPNAGADKFMGKGAKASSMPYETKAWEETLILKLAEMLKHKGFNVNSAFGIFDKDCNDTISLLNFKDIVLFTLKFTSSQEELERLTHVVFNGKNVINKLDFYKIFSPLLPANSAETDNNNNVFLSDALNKSNHSINSSLNAYNASIRIKKNNFENQIVESVSINLVPNSNNFYNTNKNLSNNFQDLNMSGTNNFNNMSVNSTAKENFNNTNANNKFGSGSSNNVNYNINNFATGSNFNTNSNFKTSSPKNDHDVGSKNRSLFEIVAKINEYMEKTSKNTIVEIYKMFDKDANSLVDKNELAAGFSKLGIQLSFNELDKVWRDVTENNIKRDKFDYKLFKMFYERYTNK